MALQMLDVLIGVIVIFVVFSSAASMLAELVEIALQRRGRLLEKALGQMFAAPTAAATALAAADAAGAGKSGGKPKAGARKAAAAREEARSQQLAAFYNSPALFPLFDGVYGKGERFRLPSEIPPTRFAAALLKLAQDDRLKAQFQPVLAQILDQAGLSIEDVRTRADEVRAALVEHYEQSMQRVSGWYRRHVQIVLLACGFGLAAAMNVDTLAVIRALSVDGVLRQQMVASAGGLALPDEPACPPSASPATADAAAADCERRRRAAFDERLRVVGGYGLPIGWAVETPPAAAADPECGRICRSFAWFFEDLPRGFEKLIGLLLTGLAAAQGAPYWFELLKKLLAARQAVSAAGKARDPAAR